MSLRSIRQISVLTSRALAARSAPASRLCLPVLARCVTVPAARTFSVSARRFAEGSTDVVLSQKLAEELQFEKNASINATEPEFLQSFKEQKIWKIEDTSGQDEVALTRKFFNENIRLVFSIADIQTHEEPSFEDEEGDEESVPEDEPIHSYGVRVAFTVTKANGPGSLTVETLCQEGAFMVDSVSFFQDAKIGATQSPDAEWKRRSLYLGPQFDTLDVTVQDEFEKFLQERGINESLAIFIPEYAEYKEQKEYVKWLGSVKNFIDL